MKERSEFFTILKYLCHFQVHSLFSLLGLNHAYVTNTGRLAGVVALKEVGGSCFVNPSSSRRTMFRWKFECHQDLKFSDFKSGTVDLLI